MEKEKSSKKVILLAIILILIGVVFISWDYFLEKRQNAYDEISFVLSDIPEISIEEEVPEDEEVIVEDIVQEEEKQEVVYSYQSETTGDFILSKNYYVGKLVIPKINLAKGFAAKNSKQNNVDKNVAIMTPSDYPDVTKGNFILAAHAGRSWNSFFRDLEDLRINDEAIVYYKNKKYVYKLVKTYKQPRGSNLKIYRDLNETTMTLITCSMYDEKSQVIFIFER